MTARIVVDELRPWPTNVPALKPGSCHLTIEHDEQGGLDLERLHVFAAGLGLRRDWFQGRARVPHYKLAKGVRKSALRHGAVFVPAREQTKARLLAKGKITPATAARLP